MTDPSGTPARIDDLTNLLRAVDKTKAGFDAADNAKTRSVARLVFDALTWGADGKMYSCPKSIDTHWGSIDDYRAHNDDIDCGEPKMCIDDHFDMEKVARYMIEHWND